MANQLALNGAQPRSQKPARFTDLYNARWSSGLWTNRSPMRDAVTNRLQEKFYGAAGDALIAGSNVEITNRLTLARRPGLSTYDSNSYSNVDRFEEFHMFSGNSSQINVMVDQSNALYSLYNAVKSIVWTKSSNAGQAYMQSVGNSLYFGDGVNNKKWVNTMFARTTSTSALPNIGNSTLLDTVNSVPYMGSFVVDSNGYLQQLVGFKIQQASNVAVTSNVVTLTVPAVTGITVGSNYLLLGFATNTYLNGATINVTSATGTTVVGTLVNCTHTNVVSNADTGYISSVGGNPTTGSGLPTWSTVIPASGNNFQGGITLDGTVLWQNRGVAAASGSVNPNVMNWGIAAPTTAPAVGQGTGGNIWTAHTYYSNAGVVVDNNNIWQVTVGGLSGSSNPFPPSPSLNQTVTSGAATFKAIQLAATTSWSTHTAFTPGTSFVIATPSGSVPCLFQLQVVKNITLTGTTQALFVQQTASGGNNLGWSGVINQPTYWNGSSFVPATVASGPTTVNSLEFNAGGDPNQTLQCAILNGAGEGTGFTTPWAGATGGYSMCVFGSFNVPVAGSYTFNISHDDGFFFGIGNGPATALLKSGNNTNAIGQTQTPCQGYTVLGGNNVSGYNPNEKYTVFFPVAGTYGFEFAYSNWKDNSTFVVTCNNANIINGTSFISGPTQPAWPTFVTNYAPKYPTVTETHSWTDVQKQYIFNIFVGYTTFTSTINCPFTWANLGPVSDFAWQNSTTYTTSGSFIIDSNGNQEAPYRTGATGTTQPTKWTTTTNGLTKDNPNLIWINQGLALGTSAGTLSAGSTQGWIYAIALVNTLDNTVSNCGLVSSSTGPVTGASGISIPAGSGLPAASSIDPQADYVAIFRTTDGGGTPFLIPGTGNAIYTVPLTQYLINGYVDTTQDTGLENLITGAFNGENTPPLPGAKNLCYHLNRIFYSIGNTVYYTSGPSAPIGNGVNGTAPSNFDGLPSQVVRLVPLTAGILVFTVSDIYYIDTHTGTVLPAVPLLKGVGLLSYNALDHAGSYIGFFTTDLQFVILEPNAGLVYAGHPIGNLLRQNNGQAGTSWNASTAYVTYHVEGEDQAWYLSDGVNGWYRILAQAPAPEFTGPMVAPFATITGGCKAVQSIEVTPGVHKLLVGPTGTGTLLKRDLTTATDNGSIYNAYAVLGSVVLAQPGQLAEVAFITTDSINVGVPISLAVVFNEALPYYTGAFDTLTNWTTDPPNLPRSKSILGQRFYVAEANNPNMTAACRHMQVQINFGTQNAQNELLTLTIYGAYVQEM